MAVAGGSKVPSSKRPFQDVGSRLPGSGHHAYEGFREAMYWFEKAEAVRPTGNDDALLRWNTCARMIERNHLSAREDERIELPLE